MKGGYRDRFVGLVCAGILLYTLMKYYILAGEASGDLHAANLRRPSGNRIPRHSFVVLAESVCKPKVYNLTGT